RRIDRGELDGFPSLDFADPRVKWADLNGDGLKDLAVVMDGAVEYWPSQGRGRFGPKVTMRGGPRLPWGWDARRLLIGDVDGDGAADLAYVEDRRVTVWLNRGECWSEPLVIRGTPGVVNTDAVTLVDLLGVGVSGVLWSRAAGVDPQARMWFLDFTG